MLRSSPGTEFLMLFCLFAVFFFCISSGGIYVVFVKLGGGKVLTQVFKDLLYLLCPKIVF